MLFELLVGFKIRDGCLKSIDAGLHRGKLPDDLEARPGSAQPLLTQSRL